MGIVVVQSSSSVSKSGGVLKPDKKLESVEMELPYDTSLPFFSPPQQNLWVTSGSGKRPIA
jgi:hypothetical protein